MSALEIETREEAPYRRVSFALKDGEMTGLAFGQEGPPDLIFIHATGLNARTYRRLLAPLGERMSVLALDTRGHGRTQLPPKLWSYNSWNRHRDDIIQLIDKHIGMPAVFAGHSMGATVSLLIAGKRPDLVRSIAMIDPVIMPEARYRLFETPLFGHMAMRSSPLVRGARKRRAHFESKAAAQAALTGRGFFKTWPAEMLADYVEDGFVEDEGGVKLTCSPAYEAATFSAHRHDPWRALTTFRGPLAVLRAEIGSTLAPSVAQRLKEVRHDARIATVDGSTHALPMERPDRARAAIETALLMAGGKKLADLD